MGGLEARATVEIRATESRRDDGSTISTEAATARTILQKRLMLTSVGTSDRGSSSICVESVELSTPILKDRSIPKF